jgi:septal ring factor EnvC (AmiA/AmiB activator)
MENIYSVLIAIVTVLGSAAAFRFYEKRSMHRDRDEDFIRHDCRDRIAKLEALLAESAREKDDLRKMILDLTGKVAELKVTVDFLRSENDDLHKKLTTRTRKKTV